jgi:small conductance mechanosensitive channel
MNAAAIAGQVETFWDALTAWAALSLPNIVTALLLLAVGWWLAGRAESAVNRLANGQRRIDPTLSTILSSLVRYAIMIVVVVAALGQLGIQTTSVLAALGAIGLAIGLALQGTLSNVAAGVMIIWLRPFKVGDFVEAKSFAGAVKSVGLFACELHTFDGIFLFVPNSELWNTRVINYSRLPTRMVDLRFSVLYSENLAKARQILLDLTSDDPRVRKEPPPRAFIDKLDDSTISIGLRAWTETSEFWNLRWDLIEGGKAALQDAGFDFPLPQRNVHLQYPPRERSA